jgi:hypothetical protein
VNTPAAPARRGSRLRAAAPTDSIPTPTPAPANSSPSPGSTMAAKCPHCSAAIESLSGFVPQADLEARLKEKNTKVDELTRQINELTPKAAGYDTVNTALATAQRDLTTAREDFALATKHGIKDPLVLAGLRAVHAATMAALPEDKRVPLDGWVEGDGRAHPFVAPVLAPSAAPPAASAAPGAPVPVVTPPAAPAAPPPAVAAPAAAVTPPANQLPAVNTNAVTPPAQTAKLTPEQLAAHFASPAYLALKPEERRAERARLEAQYGGQAQQRPVAA